MISRKPLSSSLPPDSTTPDSDDVSAAFDAAQTADEFAPLPRGNYVAVAVEGGLTESRTGTKGYKVSFRVIEGEYTNRRVWRTWYLTAAAVTYSKRDLAKLGIDSGKKLLQPLPAERFVVKLQVALRKLDDGTETNEVKTMEVIRIQEPAIDAFAPGLDLQKVFDELDGPTEEATK